MVNAMIFIKSKKTLLLILQAVFFFGISPIANSQVPIDLFTEPLNVNPVEKHKEVVDPIVIKTVTNYASIIKGVRDISFKTISKISALDGNGTYMAIAGGQLDLTMDSGVVGIATLQYDGTPKFPGVSPENPDNITYKGLGEIDLNALGTEIRFNVVDTDQGFPIVFEFYSSKTEFTKVEVETIEGPKVIPFVVLSTFCGYVRPNEIPDGVDPSLVSVTCGGDNGDVPVNVSKLGAMQARFNQSLSGITSTGKLDMLIESIVITGEAPLACRVTGGGVEADYSLADGTPIFAWDGTVEDGTATENSPVVDGNGDYRYTFGGLVGANTVFPEIAGQWEHNEHGDLGTFAFHAGGKFAKAGTQISKVVCSDPDFCNPARHAPAKQIDFEGVGTFNNIGKARNEPYFLIADANVIPEPKAKVKGVAVEGGYTLHAFEVNIDDAGEGPADYPQDCPVNGFGLHGDQPSITDGEFGFCSACSDFYRITIYKGVPVEDFTDENGVVRVANPSELPKTEEDIIYQVFGYHNGNTQIHPPTGFDLKSTK